jgi:serine/threonine protein kinase
MSDTMPDLATITAAGVTDFAEKISEICTNKKDRDKVKKELSKLGEITITKNGHEKKFVLTDIIFYRFGGYGIIIGLNDLGKSASDLQYVLKFDCASNPTSQGETLRTAIRINREFIKYGQDGEYTNNMAMYYGNVGTTSDGPPSHPPISFAMYKYLGFALGSILSGTDILSSLDDKKKTIVNVISCLMRFNKNLFIHGDISIDNFVYNSHTGEIELIDFDTMQNLTEISKSQQGKVTADVNKDTFEICPNPNPHNQCLTYYYYCRRLCIPEMGVLFGMSTPFGRNMREPIQHMDTKSIIINLMRADKIGLFWVIIQILLSSGPNGLSEDEIEGLLGIKFDGTSKTIESYYSFYTKNNRSIDFFTEPLVKNLKIGDGDILFKDFIEKLLEFIQFGRQVGMDTLLKHPFLFLTRFEEKVNLFVAMENKTQGEYDLIYESAKKFLTTTNHVKSQCQSDRKKVVEMVNALNAAYEKYEQLQKSQEPVSVHAGGNKKNRASSGNRTKKRNKRNKQNRRNRTKKRNKRNKQNRRNRTKKTKSRTRLVRRYK